MLFSALNLFLSVFVDFFIYRVGLENYSNLKGRKTKTVLYIKNLPVEDTQRAWIVTSSAYGMYVWK